VRRRRRMECRAVKEEETCIPVVDVSEPPATRELSLIVLLKTCVPRALKIPRTPSIFQKD
jgi:hypothetical protein